MVRCGTAKSGKDRNLIVSPHTSLSDISDNPQRALQSLVWAGLGGRAH